MVKVTAEGIRRCIFRPIHVLSSRQLREVRFLDRGGKGKRSCSSVHAKRSKVKE